MRGSGTSEGRFGRALGEVVAELRGRTSRDEGYPLNGREGADPPGQHRKQPRSFAEVTEALTKKR